VSDEEATPLNWVERRANREKLLAAQSGEVWQSVRAAVQDACESFNRRYTREARERADCKLENGTRIRIVRELSTDPRVAPIPHNLTVQFDGVACTITVTRQNQVSSPLKVSADDHAVFLLHGHDRITADEASEVILKPLLFPK
jgi:hypothetical protein